MYAELFNRLNALTNTKLIRLSVCLSLSIILLLSLVADPVLAQGQRAGVSISPAVVEETLDPGEVKQYDLQITNSSDEDQEYFLFTRNIAGVRDGGVPIFQENINELTGYELADWIELNNQQVSIPANSSVGVSYTLSVPDNASPGSHFGGVFVSVEPPQLEGSGAAVGYQVANIVSIRVSGEAIEEASIRQFSTDKFFHGSQNVNFTLRIENTGNVLVRPSGPLEIYNMLGNKVGDVTFNPDTSAVFPGSTREFANVNWTGDSIGLGRYEAIVSPAYGEAGAYKTMSSTVTFWVLPMNIIGPALIVLAVLLLTVFISVKLYIKRSLAHLNQGRRIVQKRRRQNSSATLLITVTTLTVTALFLIVLLALFA
jgi:hypothetical protein